MKIASTVFLSWIRLTQVNKMNLQFDHELRTCDRVGIIWARDVGRNIAIRTHNARPQLASKFIACVSVEKSMSTTDP